MLILTAIIRCMQIIDVTVKNHRSIRDEVCLDLARPSLKTNLPKGDATWATSLYPATAIYGANASGKTSVVRAIHFIRQAISSSAAQWLSEEQVVRDPFRLDTETVNASSVYRISFVLTSHWKDDGPPPAGGVRYDYAFSLSPEGVNWERLDGYSTQRATRLLERVTKDGVTSMKVAPGLGGVFEVSSRELALSRALRTGRRFFHQVAKDIVEGIETVGLSSNEQLRRFSIIMSYRDNNRLTLHELVAIAQAADVGILDIKVNEEEVEPREDLWPLVGPLIEVAIKASFKDAERGGKSDSSHSEQAKSKSLPSDVRSILTSLVFRHNSREKDGEFDLLLGDQSEGTRSWLSLVVVIIHALRAGSVALVDELDTSLHPYLTAQVVRLFQDPDTNPKGAQLIFTTHDVSLLAPNMDLGLERGQVWITEKDRYGATELYSLGDFTDLNSKSNLSKQFLEGRFGGVPWLAPSLLSLVAIGEDGE